MSPQVCCLGPVSVPKSLTLWFLVTEEYQQNDFMHAVVLTVCPPGNCSDQSGAQGNTSFGVQLLPYHSAGLVNTILWDLLGKMFFRVLFRKSAVSGCWCDPPPALDVLSWIFTIVTRGCLDFLAVQWLWFTLHSLWVICSACGACQNVCPFAAFLYLLIQNPMLYKPSCRPSEVISRMQKQQRDRMMEALRKPVGQGGQVELLLLQYRQDLCFGIWHMQQAFMWASCSLSSDA